MNSNDNNLYSFFLLKARNVLMEDLFCLRCEFYNIFSSLRKPLCEFIKEKINQSGRTEQFVVDLLLDCIRPSLRKILLAEKEINNRRAASFDIISSVENVLRRNFTEVVQLFCNEGLFKFLLSD